MRALLLAALLGLFTNQALAQFDTPGETVRTMIESVLTIVHRPGYDLERDRPTIDAIITDAFDTATMAQFALDRNIWRGLTEAQRSEFEQLLFIVLKDIYIDRLNEYTNQSVEYLGESVDGARGQVRTNIVTSSNALLPVNYNLRRRPNGWYIYDVEVENVSLLSSYRSEYLSIVRRSGVDALLAQLRQRVSEL